MEVREHLSQHETVRTLPLITESATVTAVEPMDRSRNGEVIRTIREMLEANGNEAWRRERPEGKTAQRRLLRDKLDRVDRGAPLNEYLGDGVRGSAAESELRSLQDRYIRPYPSLVRIAVETDEPIDFVAGQYLGVRYGGTTRVYSIASSPARENLKFCIRRVPGGRLTPTLSADLEPGDGVTLRGPFGDFVMEPPSGRDLVFLATGTGVAPFKSMLDICFEQGRETYRGETRDVWLFLGCAWADDLPYREAFRALERDHKAFHFVPTLSRERCLSSWDGETAYVQHVLGKYVTEAAFHRVDLPAGFDRARRDSPKEEVDARIDPENVEVYACGINAMVYGLVDAVERLGVPDRHTQFEGFG